MASRILVVDDSPTIRRVVTTILERSGYEASPASDGQEALDALTSGDVKADLVLLDFVMPRMNGYQFCRALRDDAELAATPVVLMSARGDRIRDQFVQQTGAIDAITKPFDAQVLVAVVENALRKVNTQALASSARLPEPEPRDEPMELVAPETRRIHMAGIVAQNLAAVVARVLADRPHASTGELTRLLAERLEREAIVEMVEAVRDLDEADATPALSGDLGIVPIGAILQLLQAENQSGVLVCRSDGAEVTATFRGGLIDLVQSSGAGDEFRLGRFFVEEGIVSSQDIDELVARSAEEPQPTSTIKPRTDSDPTLAAAPRAVPAEERVGCRPRLLGVMLLESRKITEAQLRSALTRQSSELLYEVLRWSNGRFAFRRRVAAEVVQSARLGLPVASVVMEGFRRADEWRALEKTLGSFDAVLVRDDAAFGSLDVGQLPDREKTVLDLVDGDRTVRQIVTASHLSSFEACRILVQFLHARALRPRA